MEALRDLLLQTTPSAVLIVSLLKATIVLTIAQLLVSALPRLSASMRHLILTAAMSSFVLIPLVALAAPRWNVKLPHDQQVAAAPTAGAPALAAPTSGQQTTADAVSVNGNVQSSGTRWSALQIAGAIWALVSLFLIARLARSAARVRGIVRDASNPSDRVLELFEEVRWRLSIHSSVRVLESEQIAVPMAWGVRRGTLLLPSVCNDWTDDELRATLIHELAHLQRLDYVSLTLINVVSALLWFHPQIWTARGRALAEGERACDDLVVRAGERASGYASHLLQVARLMPKRDPLMALLAMSRPSQLEGRMYALLSPTINRQAIGRKLLMSVITLFFAAVLPFSMMQFTAEAAMEAPPAAMNFAATPEAPMTASQSTRTRSWESSTGTCADYRVTFDGREGVRSEERIEVGGRRLTVAASQNGGVHLRRSANGAFGVTACKSATSEQLLSQIALQERGGEVSVNGPEENDWTVHLIVEVPDGASIDATAHNGPLAVTGVDATVAARVTNGPLTLTDSRGQITASAVNGPLSIRRMSGDVEANVQNGPLTVNLEDYAWEGGELRTSVQNGPLTVKVPENYGSGVLVTMRGHGPFACSLPECSSLRAPANYYGPWRPEEVRLGNGSTNVFIQGGNGPIAISD